MANVIDTTRWLERTETILETLTEDRIWQLLEDAAARHDLPLVALYHRARRGNPGARIEVAERLAQAELEATA